MILFDAFDNKFLGGVAVDPDGLGGGEIVASKVNSPLSAWELDSRVEAVRFIRKMQIVTPYRGGGLADELMDACRWLALELVSDTEPPRP
jgi:hypothetical protein